MRPSGRFLLTGEGVTHLFRVPPPEDNIRTGSEDRDVSQPPPLAKTFWKTFLDKMAITLRLFGKEVYRKKLQWFDLRRADYRLGKKAYDTQSSMSDQNQTSDRISEIQNQIKALGDPESSAPSSKQKIKNSAKGAGRLLKLQILKFKRNQLFRKLGRQLRQSSNIDGSVVAEAEQSRSVLRGIDVVTSEIRTLAGETYLWARRPLLASFLLLPLIVGLASYGAEEQRRVQGGESQRKIKTVETRLAAVDVDQKRQAQPKAADLAQSEELKVFREKVKWEILTNARLKVLYKFPKDVVELGSLYADKAENLYGIENETNSARTAFKITPSGELTAILHWNKGDLAQNSDPDLKAGFVQGRDSAFYGISSVTAIYRLTEQGQFSVIHKFGRNEGQDPQNGLILGKDGNFYGVNRWGGAAGGGTIFKVTSDGTLTILHNFVTSSDDGCYPEARLVQASDGSFYGTTSVGGTDNGSGDRRGTVNGGTIFRMGGDGEVTILHRLNERPWRSTWTNADELEGRHPNIPLLEGTDGNLYGATTQAGKNGQGTIFKVTPKGELTVLYDFKDEGPMVGGLVNGADGKIYGITSGVRRTPNHGTLLRIDPKGDATTMHVFRDKNNAGDPTEWFAFADPAFPVSGLQSGNGDKLYGLTAAGGAHGTGVLFQFDPSDSFIASKEDTLKAESIAASKGLPERRRSGEEIVTEFISGIAKAAAEADAANLADSKSVVAAAAGAKMLCPKCGGSKKMVQHNYDPSWNPHKRGTLE